jgi:hypothetical protein
MSSLARMHELPPDARELYANLSRIADAEGRVRGLTARLPALHRGARTPEPSGLDQRGARHDHHRQLLWQCGEHCKAGDREGETMNANEIIDRRAAQLAQTLGVSKEFMLVDMNWRSLALWVRALLSGGCCSSCASKVEPEDICFEHVEPPRHSRDWERYHARNFYLVCRACAETRGSKSYHEWLDEQEAARLARSSAH